MFILFKLLWPLFQAIRAERKVVIRRVGRTHVYPHLPTPRHVHISVTNCKIPEIMDYLVECYRFPKINVQGVFDTARTGPK
jgi:hypothetical protein